MGSLNIRTPLASLPRWVKSRGCLDSGDAGRHGQSRANERKQLLSSSSSSRGIRGPHTPKSTEQARVALASYVCAASASSTYSLVEKANLRTVRVTTIDISLVRLFKRAREERGRASVRRTVTAPQLVVPRRRDRLVIDHRAVRRVEVDDERSAQHHLPSARRARKRGW